MNRYQSRAAELGRPAARLPDHGQGALLELLNDQRFARNFLPEENQLQRVILRRLKSA